MLYMDVDNAYHNAMRESWRASLDLRGLTFVITHMKCYRTTLHHHQSKLVASCPLSKCLPRCPPSMWVSEQTLWA